MRYDIHDPEVTVTPQIEKIVAEKLAKLDERLKSYHPEAARLEMRLRRQEKKQLLSCALTLHAYQEELHVEKEAVELREAVDRAFDALFREVEHYRARINKSLQSDNKRNAGAS
jgi:ribosomal subunit interface protein